MSAVQLPGIAGGLFVVTGAAGGQGAEEALSLASQGGDVIAADIREEAADLLAAADLPGTVTYRRLDVSNETSWRSLAGTLEGRPVKGLVNNAGVTSRIRIGAVDRGEWDPSWRSTSPARCSASKRCCRS